MQTEKAQRTTKSQVKSSKPVEHDTSDGYQHCTEKQNALHGVVIEEYISCDAKWKTKKCIHRDEGARMAFHGCETRINPHALTRCAMQQRLLVCKWVPAIVRFSVQFIG